MIDLFDLFARFWYLLHIFYFFVSIQNFYQLTIWNAIKNEEAVIYKTKAFYVYSVFVKITFLSHVVRLAANLCECKQPAWPILVETIYRLLRALSRLMKHTDVNVSMILCKWKHFGKVLVKENNNRTETLKDVLSKLFLRNFELRFASDLRRVRTVLFAVKFLFDSPKSELCFPYLSFVTPG